MPRKRQTARRAITLNLGSAAEAAAAIGVDKRTIERWCDAGYLTRYRLGPKLVRIDLDELAALAVPEPVRGGDAA